MSPPTLVVISRLQKIDSTSAHAIHQAMFLRESTRPAARESVLQWLGLTDSGKRSPHDVFDELKSAKCNLPIGFNPVPKILSKLGVKYCFHFCCPLVCEPDSIFVLPSRPSVAEFLLSSLGRYSQLSAKFAQRLGLTFPVGRSF